jgi:hypothetical protein
MKHTSPKLFYPHELQEHGEINILQSKSYKFIHKVVTISYI